MKCPLHAWYAFCLINVTGLCVLYLLVNELRRDQPLPRHVDRFRDTLLHYLRFHRVLQEDGATKPNASLCDVNTLDGLHAFSDLYLEWVLSGTRKPLTNSCTLSIRPTDDSHDDIIVQFYKAYRKLMLAQQPVSEVSGLIRLENGIGCEAKRSLTNRRALSHGTHKFSYGAMYQGREVAVRTPFIFSNFSKNCLLHERKSLPTCYAAVTRFFVQEIWFHQILRHANIIKLLGYCVPKKLFDGTVDTTVTMVTEMGIPLNLSNMTWDQKLQIGYEVADLMDYARRHPNGSVEFRDFAMRQFVMVNNTAQFVDMESFRVGEMQCQSMDDCASKHWNPQKRAIRVPCVNGSCVGLNEKLNVWMYNFYLLGKYILPDSPLIFRRSLSNMVLKGDKGEVGIEVIKEKLRKMILARSFMYQQLKNTDRQ